MAFVGFGWVRSRFIVVAVIPKARVDAFDSRVQFVFILVLPFAFPSSERGRLFHSSGHQVKKPGRPGMNARVPSATTGGQMIPHFCAGRNGHG